MSSGTLYYALVALLSYILYVRFHRFSRIKAIHRAYAQRHQLAAVPPLRATSAKSGRRQAPTSQEYPMTPAEAQEILRPGAELDMPFTITKALEFALFLTYGIETISDVLLSSSEFIDTDKAGRRYVDTSILIGSFLRYPLVGPGSGVKSTSADDPLDPRGAIALARINLQHSHYKAITNNDLLYTLSTFIREPASWAERFEWRPLTPVEQRAWFVFFAEIGRRMGIEEIPDELQDLLEWSEAYEEEHMLPNEKSRKVADATTELLLFNVPIWAKEWGRSAVACLMSDRLRKSVMAPQPPSWLRTIVYSFLSFRAFLLLHFVPPRPSSMAVGIIPDPIKHPAFPPGYQRSDKEADADKSDRYAPMSHPRSFMNEPWYMPVPSTPSLWVQKSLIAVGLLNPRSVPGKSFKPDGYRLETMGPAKWEGKEIEEVRQRAEKIQGGKLEGPYAVGGVPRARCPFAA